MSERGGVSFGVLTIFRQDGFKTRTAFLDALPVEADRTLCPVLAANNQESF